MDEERPAEEAGEIRKEKMATIGGMHQNIRAPVCRNCPFHRQGQASEPTRPGDTIEPGPTGGWAEKSVTKTRNTWVIISLFFESSPEAM